MTLQDLVNLAEGRDLSKSYPKADGNYIWDYILEYAQDFNLQLRLIASNSSKAGFKDKVSVDELITYIKSEWADGTVPYQINITGVEGITIARI